MLAGAGFVTRDNGLISVSPGSLPDSGCQTRGTKGRASSLRTAIRQGFGA